MTPPSPTRLFALLLAASVPCTAPAASQEWPVYGGDPGGTRFSTLRHINTRNVHRLQPAWVYRCDDMRARPATTIECNPLVVDRTLYLTTPSLKVVALDAATGTERWTFDPWDGRGGGGVSRGLTLWAQGDERRLFSAAGNHLFALNPDTGHPIPGFGTLGRIDLREGLDRDLLRQGVGLTTPGVVYRDLIILGSRVDDSPAAKAPGHIRAYDVRTGERRWIFHTIPQPGEPGHETWPPEAWRTAAGCNAWGGLTLDVERGLVFAGTGSAAYDHYGGDRPGMNLYGNSTLALDAATGQYRWHFQIVHHDLWDYDLPCPPVLVTVRHRGRRIDAAAQTTKTGHLFLFHRVTGEPLFPIEERPVPASDLPGETAWPTQPFPSRPPAFAQQGFTRDDVTDLNPEARAHALKQLETIEPAPLYAPPSLKARAVLPQFNGGAEWGGQAFDPESRTLFVNASNEAEWMAMVPAKPTDTVSLHAFGEHLFNAMCLQCHGPQGSVLQEAMSAVPAIANTVISNDLPSVAAGVPPAVEGGVSPPGIPSDSVAARRSGITQEYPAGVTRPPSLAGLSQRLSPADAKTLLETGRGQMPAFATLGDLERRALVAFLYGQGQSEQLPAGSIDLAWADRFPYLATGHHEWVDPEGFPINRRPWGTLTAIDLDRGRLAWQVPLGTYPVLEQRGEPPTGTFNIGGPIVTAGGLVFIGATRDERLRAFDKRTGRVLWEHQLDAGAYATPATYAIDGEQYLVVAAGGGGKAETKAGNAYWCFKLPDQIP